MKKAQGYYSVQISIDSFMLDYYAEKYEGYLEAEHRRLMFMIQEEINKNISDCRHYFIKINTPETLKTREYEPPYDRTLVISQEFFIYIGNIEEAEIGEYLPPYTFDGHGSFHIEHQGRIFEIDKIGWRRVH